MVIIFSPMAYLQLQQPILEEIIAYTVEEKAYTVEEVAYTVEEVAHSSLQSHAFAFFSPKTYLQ